MRDALVLLLLGGWIGSCGGSDDPRFTTQASGTGDGSTSGGSDPNCGDGVLQEPEECDGTDFGADSCEARGYDRGTLACHSNCRVDTQGCARCGNGIKEGGETCDGSDAGRDATSGMPLSCGDFGEFASGTLGCTDACDRVLTDDCLPPRCGDGIVNLDDVCDDTDLAGQTCATAGNFTGGTLACKADCTGFDTSACTEPTCGDGVAEGMEGCDGSDFKGATCVSIGMMTMTGFGAGDLGCTATCEVDTSACLVCGAVGALCTSDDDCCPGNGCLTLAGLCIPGGGTSSSSSSSTGSGGTDDTGTDGGSTSETTDGTGSDSTGAEATGSDTGSTG